MSAEASDTRQRIIDTALALFGQIGFARATTRAIAAAAEVNEVTLFRHFGSKKQLLAACVASFNDQGFAATFTQNLTGDYAHDILTMAQTQIAGMLAGFDLVRLLLCDAQEMPDLQQIAAVGAQGNTARVADYFRQQIDAGVVRADLDPLALAQAFDSLFSWPVVIEKVLATGRTPSDQLIQQWVDLFVQGTRS